MGFLSCFIHSLALEWSIWSFERDCIARTRWLPARQLKRFPWNRLFVWHRSERRAILSAFNNISLFSLLWHNCVSFKYDAYESQKLFRYSTTIILSTRPIHLNTGLTHGHLKVWPQATQATSIYYHVRNSTAINNNSRAMYVPMFCVDGGYLLSHNASIYWIGDNNAARRLLIRVHTLSSFICWLCPRSQRYWSWWITLVSVKTACLLRL